jgi:hypothetical protein
MYTEQRAESITDKWQCHERQNGASIGHQDNMIAVTNGWPLSLSAFVISDWPGPTPQV